MTIKLNRETPKPFNTTFEVSANNGKNLVSYIAALIDTGQNIKEGILLKKDFCGKLGLQHELIPNLGALLACANPGSKINIFLRLRKGVFKLNFLTGPIFFI